MHNQLVDLALLDDRIDLKNELLESALGVVQEVAVFLREAPKTGITDRSKLVRFEKALEAVSAVFPSFGQRLPTDLVRSAVEIARQVVK